MASFNRQVIHPRARRHYPPCATRARPSFGWRCSRDCFSFYSARRRPAPREFRRDALAAPSASVCLRSAPDVHIGDTHLLQRQRVQRPPRQSDLVRCVQHCRVDHDARWGRSSDHVAADLSVPRPVGLLHQRRQLRGRALRMFARMARCARRPRTPPSFTRTTSPAPAAPTRA